MCIVLIILFFVVHFAVLEIATHDYGNHNGRLVEKIQNGLVDAYRKCKESTAQIYALGAVGKLKFK